MSILYNNKSIKLSYEIIERFDCGIVLKGWEVKSIKNNSFSLDGSFVKIINNNVYLEKFQIFPLKHHINRGDREKLREKKLLLKKEEILKIKSRVLLQSKLGIVSKIFLSENNRIKVEISFVKSLKKFDKRRKIKEKELKKFEYI